MRILRFIAYLVLMQSAMVMAHGHHDHSHDHAHHDHGHDHSELPIMIEGAWARETPPNAQVSAAYMTIHAKEFDRLVKASGAVAKTIELHTHLLEDGVMKMREVSAIEINPEEPATLKPGGLHIMLIDLVEPLKQGESFFLTLHFEKAGEMTFEVPVHRGAPSAHSHQH